MEVMFTVMVSVDSSSSQGTVQYYVYTESFSFCALTKNGDICRAAHGIARDDMGSYTGIVPSQGMGTLSLSSKRSYYTKNAKFILEPAGY